MWYLVYGIICQIFKKQNSQNIQAQLKSIFLQNEKQGKLFTATSNYIVLKCFDVFTFLGISLPLCFEKNALISESTYSLKCQGPSWGWKFLFVDVLIPRNSYVLKSDFVFSVLFINDYNIWPLMFYFLICRVCKIPKYFTFVILQHWLWFMQEPFVFIQSQIPCTGTSVLRTEDEPTTWVALSNFSLESLHRGDIFRWSMPFLLCLLWVLVLGQHIRLTVFCFNSPAFNHCHLLWSCILALSLKNWPCFFTFHAACLSFFYSLSFHQSLFLVVTFQLHPLEVSCCCLQHNHRG